MSGLDARHRWEVTERSGATVTHTCRVCGKKATFEFIVPHAVVEALMENLRRPNPYRSLFV